MMRSTGRKIWWKRNYKKKETLLTKRTHARMIGTLIENGDEKEEYAYTLDRERNPLAVRFLGERYAEGSF
jgi:hypothetical protein